MPDLIQFSFRPYRRPFATSAPFAFPEPGNTRTGFILRATKGMASYYSEISPLPSFGSETCSAAHQFIARLPNRCKIGDLRAAMNPSYPASCYALDRLLEKLAPEITSTAPHEDKSIVHCVQTAALLPLQPNSGQWIAALRPQGFRVFKIKMGRALPSEEWQWLKTLMTDLLPGERLRLDPNRSWNPAAVAFWQPRLKDFQSHIEFLEEPIPRNGNPITAHMEDLAKWPVAIALDETLNECSSALQQAISMNWRGFYVMKPAIQGPICQWHNLLSQASQRVVISSVFETAIGLSDLIHLAARAFPGTCHGLGTQALFADNWQCPQNGAKITSIPTFQQARIWEDCAIT